MTNMRHFKRVLMIWSTALALCAGAALAASAEQDTSRLLVSHWTMDGPAERGAVRDASPAALHGVLSPGAVIRSCPGRFGRALDFAGGSWQGFGTAPLKWSDGKWYHVAFINDRVDGKTIVRSNDCVRAANGNALGPAGLRVTPTHVQLGALNGAYHFGGRVDDVRLYNIALCKADVRALFEGKPISGKR